MSRARRVIQNAFLAFGAILAASPLFAGFASTETFLPAIGRVAGQNGAQFYTTIWATNLTSARQTFTLQFLKVGQANTSPASFDDSLEPGQTKVYENVVETKLHSTGLGAARVISSGEIFLAERIYNQEPGNDLGNTEGLFFAGVPKNFSITLGQSASIQGIDQGGSENFRYNFALVETGGGSPTVNVQIFDGSGTLLGQKAFILQPYEQLQPGVGDVVSGIMTTNARITATVTGGSGSVLLAGAQVANESQDSSGFEMTFRDSLLGTGGGGSGLTAVSHDASLAGNGTGTSPLGIANGQVVRSINGLHDAVTFVAGSNVTITPSGSTLTISSTGGGGGGLTLPFTGSTNDSTTSFAVSNAGGGAIAGNSSASNVAAIDGKSTGTGGSGVHGRSDPGTGVYGESQGSGTGVGAYSSGGYGIFSSGGKAGVEATSEFGVGVYGEVYAANTTNPGVFGKSSYFGVIGTTHGTSGQGGNAGVWGDSHDVTGVYGTSVADVGVRGVSTNSWGILGTTGNSTYAGTAGVNTGSGPGLYGQSASGSGIYATSASGNAGYFDGDLSYTGSLIHASDARFKEDIAPLPDALENTLRLRGVTFLWRRDAFPAHHFAEGRSIGFIAQEVESVFPSLVSTASDGYKGVDYAALTPILVEAIKTQQRQIDDQRRQIADLEKRLERLDGSKGDSASRQGRHTASAVAVSSTR